MDPTVLNNGKVDLESQESILTDNVFRGLNLLLKMACAMAFSITMYLQST